MFNVHVYSTHKYYFKYNFSVNILYVLVISGLAAFIFSGCLFCRGFFLLLKTKWFESFFFFLIIKLIRFVRRNFNLDGHTGSL